MAIFPLETVNALHNLWIFPVVVIPQVGRRLCLIFDFAWSGINDIAERLSPMEVMLFGGALRCILKQVLTADPCLGPFYIRKVDLEDAYMRLWVRMEDILSVAFLIPNNTPSNKQMVLFHLSLPMSYVDSAPYFCMEMETVADLANKAISHK